MTTDLPVPDETLVRFRNWVGEDASDDEDREEAAKIATPVVVAELLALAGKVLNLPASDGVDPDGFDAARWAFRELIADRCDELGVKVEEL